MKRALRRREGEKQESFLSSSTTSVFIENVSTSLMSISELHLVVTSGIRRSQGLSEKKGFTGKAKKSLLNVNKSTSCQRTVGQFPKSMPGNYHRSTLPQVNSTFPAHLHFLIFL